MSTVLRDLALGAAAWTAVVIVFATIHHVMRRRLNARKPVETTTTNAGDQS